MPSALPLHASLQPARPSCRVAFPKMTCHRRSVLCTKTTTTNARTSYVTRMNIAAPHANYEMLSCHPLTQRSPKQPNDLVFCGVSNDQTTPRKLPDGPTTPQTVPSDLTQWKLPDGPHRTMDGVDAKNQLLLHCIIDFCPRHPRSHPSRGTLLCDADRAEQGRKARYCMGVVGLVRMLDFFT